MTIKLLFTFWAIQMLVVADARGQVRITSFMAIPGNAQVILTWAPAPQASGYNVKQASVWFTDPTYSNPQTQPGQYVYRFDPAVSSKAQSLGARWRNGWPSVLASALERG